MEDVDPIRARHRADSKSREEISQAEAEEVVAAPAYRVVGSPSRLADLAPHLFAAMPRVLAARAVCEGAD